MKNIKNLITVFGLSAITIGFSLSESILPKREISDAERRPLSDCPSPTMETVLQGTFMEDFEKYTLDQFPLRDTFRSLKSVVSLYGMGKRDNNQLYYIDGYISKMDYPLNMDSVSYAAKRFRHIYDKYLSSQNVKVYCSVIPDKNYFLAEQNNYPSYNYQEMVSILLQQMDYAAYIDIFDSLDISDYYRTDTHWRQEKIYDTAALLVNGMQNNIKSQDEFQTNTIDRPFYGVYYGQLALPIQSDTIQYVTHHDFRDCLVYDYEHQKNISLFEIPEPKANRAEDLYEGYLGGPISLVSITNPNGPAERELVIFRDSFGSSIAPYLVPSYGKITLIDVRYLHPDAIGSFLSFDHQDILFLYSTGVLNSSKTIK